MIPFLFLSKSLVPETDSYWANTKLLMPGVQSIEDFSPSANYVEVFGTETYSTSVTKFGPASFDFDTDALQGLTLSAQDYDLSTSVATFEAWIYCTDFGGQTSYWDSPVFSQSENTASGDQILFVRGDGFLKFVRSSGSNGGAYNLESDTACSLNTWHHVALVFDATSTRLYLDGAKVAEGAVTTWQNNNLPLHVGRVLVPDYSTYEGRFKGYIEQPRITLNVAGYTGDSYIVPTAAFAYAPATFEWLPTEQLSPAFWLDAQDEDSITHSSRVVSNWADQTTNSIDFAQTTEASKPTKFGYSVLFDGSADYLDKPSTQVALDNATLVVVGRETANNQNRRFYAIRGVYNDWDSIDGRSLSGGNKSSSTLTSGSSSHTYWSPNGNGNNSSLNIALSPVNQKVPFGIYIVTLDGADAEMFIDGTSVGSDTGTGSQSALSNGGLRLGAACASGANGQTDPGGFLEGQILAVGHFNYTLSTSERQALEGYLAHKFGLAANLPVSHPYKSAAPTV